jgi:hypothetical protein
MCIQAQKRGDFQLVRCRYGSMMTEEDERNEEETKAVNKAKRRKGGA